MNTEKQTEQTQNAIRIEQERRTARSIDQQVNNLMSKVQHAAESVGFHKETDTQPKGSAGPESAQPKPWKSDVRLELEANLERITAQRDQLLAACKAGYASLFTWDGVSAWDNDDRKALDAMQAAIASAEGK
jgi:hypothetical protein